MSCGEHQITACPVKKLAPLTMIIKAITFEQIDYSEFVDDPWYHIPYSEVKPLSMSLCEYICF